MAETLAELHQRLKSFVVVLFLHHLDLDIPLQRVADLRLPNVAESLLRQASHLAQVFQVQPCLVSSVECLGLFSHSLF